MKSEERHQLQTNYLADRLGGTLETARPYGRIVLLGVLGVGAIALAWGVYSSLNRKSVSAAWTEYYFSLNTGDAESFKAVMEGHPGTSAGVWALQTAGDEYLADGIDALYRDRARGEELLGKAIESFEEVKSKGQGELRTRALLGLAQTHESLGELDKAKEFYNQVVAAAFQPAVTEFARERLKHIESLGGKEFYTWFGTLKPAATPPMKFNLDAPPSSAPDMQFTPTTIDTSKIELPPAPATEPRPTESAPLSLPLPNAQPAETPAAETIPAETPAASPTNDPAVPTAADAPK